MTIVKETIRVVDLQPQTSANPEDLLLINNSNQGYQSQKIKLSNLVDGIIPNALEVFRGGTGKKSLIEGAVLIGNGSEGLKQVSPGPSGNILSSNGSSWVSSPSPGTIKADPNTYGVVKAFPQEADPIVYTRNKVDELLSPINNSISALSTTVANKENAFTILPVTKGGTGTSGLSIPDGSLLQMSGGRTQLSAYVPPSWTNVSLINGWTAFGNNYSTAQYRKYGTGVVEIKGQITRASIPANGSVIFTLPLGFRPTAISTRITACDGGVCTLEIQPNGDVVFKSAPSVVFVSIELMFGVG